MQIGTKKLKELLVEPGHISESDFKRAEEKANKEKRPLEEIIIGENLISDDQLGQLKAQALGFLFVDLKREKIDENIIKTIPELVARSRGLVAFSKIGDEVSVGMTNPNDMKMRHILEKRLDSKIKPYFITTTSLKEALKYYKGSLSDEVNKLFNYLKRDDISSKEKDSVVVKLVDMILEHSHNNGASDIHIEPLEKNVVVRFRIDGVMHNVLDLPKSIYEPIISRIKILSRLRIDEHRAAQDGKFQFKLRNKKVDVRVSIVPVTNGENAVLRILSSHNRQMSLASLGFWSKDLLKVKEAINNPHGMILVTGPTGSGKTTTLYELLKTLNSEQIHIATIEDPVEYDIEGISQIQVDTRTNLTFAKGLRAIVRQDPDIIMVGEIRDKETAQIAINSAMTGHLVLSTLHANDSATTLPRLLDMEIEPFLIASTVRVVIAQRLVRKICEKCRYSYQLPEEDIVILSERPEIKRIITQKYKKNLENLILYTGRGCKACASSGYLGRVGIFEVLEVTKEIKDHIVKRSESDVILEQAVQNGMTTILDDGIGKAINGITTIDEVLRVTRGLNL